MRVLLRQCAQTTAHQPIARVSRLGITVRIAIAIFGVTVNLLPPLLPPLHLLRLKNQMEIHVRGAVTVLRVNVLVDVVAPKENLLDVLHVIRVVIAVHVMQDITDHLMRVFNAAVVKPVIRDRKHLRIVLFHRHRHHHHRPNQLEMYVHRTVNVHREHAIVYVVEPKDNLLDAMIVILMVIAKHVMQDIT